MQAVTTSPRSLNNIQAITETIKAITDSIREVFRGKPEVVDHLLAAVLAGGHVLLEDIPGTGKTTLVITAARALGLDFKRIQFTSDLMPADITGINIWNDKSRAFEFKPGPLFANMVLADEINRATPRTQSSLLEAMNEYQVTIDNTTHELPRPFFVIATQNPLELHGTYPLPESQMDRFSVRLEIGFPAPEIEKGIILDFANDDRLVNQVTPVLKGDELSQLMESMKGVTVKPAVMDYIQAVFQATRVVESRFHGLSTRAAIHLYKCARALAVIRGRTFVTPDDVKELFLPVAEHRLIWKTGAADRQEARMLLRRLLESVPVPV